MWVCTKSDAVSGTRGGPLGNPLQPAAPMEQQYRARTKQRAQGTSSTAGTTGSLPSLQTQPQVHLHTVSKEHDSVVPVLPS